MSPKTSLSNAQMQEAVVGLEVAAKTRERLRSILCALLLAVFAALSASSRALWKTQG